MLASIARVWYCIANTQHTTPHKPSLSCHYYAVSGQVVEFRLTGDLGVGVGTGIGTGTEERGVRVSTVDGIGYLEDRRVRLGNNVLKCELAASEECPKWIDGQFKQCRH